MNVNPRGISGRLCYVYRFDSDLTHKKTIMHNRTVIVVGLAGLMFAHSAVSSEWRTKLQTGPKMTVGIKVWDSQGEMTWSHNASPQDPTLGNPTSRLTYQDIDSTVAEITGHIELPQRFYLELVWGSGDIDEGSLADEDFLSAFGAQFFGTTQSGEHLFSRTVSHVNDTDLHYYSLKLGRNVFDRQDRRGGIGLFGQLQFWSEQTRAVGIRQTVCTSPNILCAPAGFVGFNDTTVIKNDVDWRSLFIGVDGYYHLNNKFTVSGTLAYSPLTKVENEDIHFLRSDLAQNPSFKLDGEGETLNAEVNLSYQFTANFAGHAGLRYWKARIDNEAAGWSAFPAGGGQEFADLNELESERKGVTLGASYSFGGRQKPDN